MSVIKLQNKGKYNNLWDAEPFGRKVIGDGRGQKHNLCLQWSQKIINTVKKCVLIAITNKVCSS